MTTQAGKRLAIDYPDLAWDIAAIEAEARAATIIEWSAQMRDVASLAATEARAAALADAAEKVRGLTNGDYYRRGWRAAVLAILEDR